MHFSPLTCVFGDGGYKEHIIKFQTFVGIIKRKVSGQKLDIKVKNVTDLCLKSYRMAAVIK